MANLESPIDLYYNPGTNYFHRFEPQFSSEFEEDAYRDWETDRKSTRLNSSHSAKSRMPSSA